MNPQSSTSQMSRCKRKGESMDDFTVSNRSGTVDVCCSFTVINTWTSTVDVVNIMLLMLGVLCVDVDCDNHGDLTNYTSHLYSEEMFPLQSVLLWPFWRVESVELRLLWLPLCEVGLVGCQLVDSGGISEVGPVLRSCRLLAPSPAFWQDVKHKHGRLKTFWSIKSGDKNTFKNTRFKVCLVSCHVTWNTHTHTHTHTHTPSLMSLNKAAV